MIQRLRFDLAYLFRPPWDTGVSPPELLTYLAARPPGHAVDLGCGSGTNLVTLARNGWQVTGVDLSSRALRLASQKIRRAGVEAVLLNADVSREISLPRSFDFALDIGCFHAVSDPQQYLNNLAAMLRRGAHWLMYGFLQTRSFRFGLTEAVLALTGSHGLRLAQRTDGADRGGRPSAWFLYERASGSD